MFSKGSLRSTADILKGSAYLAFGCPCNFSRTNWPKIFVSEMRIQELPSTAAEVLFRQLTASAETQMYYIPSLKTNIAPEHGWLGDYFPFEKADFSGAMLVVGRVYHLNE